MIEEKEKFKRHKSGLYVNQLGMVYVPKSGKWETHITLGYEDSAYGYLKVNYKGKRYQVHRLVAEVFIPNPDGKETVDHINMVKTDNRACNLRWATYKEQKNFEDQDVVQRQVAHTDYKKVAEKLSKKVLQFTLDGTLVREWSSVNECGRNGGFDKGNVSACCLGKRQSHKGFKWQYAS